MKRPQSENAFYFSQYIIYVRNGEMYYPDSQRGATKQKGETK